MVRYAHELFCFSLVGFELLAIQYPHFVVFLHILRIDDDGQKAQKYYFIPEIFFLPCPFIYTEYMEIRQGDRTDVMLCQPKVRPMREPEESEASQ